MAHTFLSFSVSQSHFIEWLLPFPWELLQQHTKGPVAVFSLCLLKHRAITLLVVTVTFTGFSTAHTFVNCTTVEFSPTT